MKKLVSAILILVLALGVAIGLLFSSGTISTSSIGMLANVALGLPGPSTDEYADQDVYRLPAGFSMTIYANDVPKARFMRFTPQGDLLVSRPHAGDVVLLRKDDNGDGKHDGMETVIEGLNRPQGMDFHQGWLYIAEREQVGRIPFNTSRASGDYEPVITGLTGDGNHWSKTLRFGPDNMLYLAQGSTCNVCVEEDERRATMMRFNPDGSGAEIFATGLRNSVGFDWAPWDDGLYATDNGRDMLGDDFPVCELNRVEQGGFYGWPYFNDNNVPDPDMGPDPLATEREPMAPAHGFRAHNAPLGIGFMDTNGWPDGFDRVALAALHGSWNRSSPDGYKVVSLHFTETGIEERDFLSGFNQDGKILGRPVDVLQGPDGAVYISDDYAGAVYRVSQESREAISPVGANKAVRLDEETPEWLASADLNAMASAGAQLYEQYNCASCHESVGTTVSLQGLNKRLGYTAVIESLREPRMPMPLFPLSEMQHRELAVYLLKDGSNEVPSH
ncbi:MAG: PQQ-dependent sugar dehydrogenase [Halioglobus sp.]